MYGGNSRGGLPNPLKESLEKLMLSWATTPHIFDMPYNEGILGLGL